MARPDTTTRAGRRHTSRGDWRVTRGLPRLTVSVTSDIANPLRHVHNRPATVRLLVVAAVAALLTAGCAYGGTPASTGALEVGGLQAGRTTVSVSELTDELDYLAANPAVAQSLVGVDVSAINAGGPAAASARMQASVALLNVHVFAALLGEAAVTQNVEPDADDIRSANDAVGRLSSQAPGMPAQLNEALLQLVSLQAALGRSIGESIAEPTEAEIRAAYDEVIGDGSDFADYRCSSHILVSFGEGAPGSATEPTDDEVATALAGITAAQQRLDAGEVFETVAGEVSDDTGSAARGGDLGCNSGGTFVPEFEEALEQLTAGEVSEPVRTQFGFHLIRLDSVGPPAFEDVEDEIASQLSQQRSDPQELLLALVTSVAADIDVVVNPRFGAWSPDQLAVVSPAGAAPAPELMVPDMQLPTFEGDGFTGP